MTDTATAKAMAEVCLKPRSSAEVEGIRQAQEAAQDFQAEKTAKLGALRLAKETSGRIASEVRRARREQRRP